MKSLAWVLLAGIALHTAVVHAAPIPSGTVFTNKLRFRIPFHFDADELRRMGAKEIQLFVSRDRGTTWRYVQAVAPDAGKFNFQATGDGEYWFNVRTLDGRNRLHPDGGNVEAGLKVIVDTIVPRLKLELRQTTPGKVQLVWRATDEHLDPAQLRLEYLQPGSPEWRPVSVVPTDAGQTEWSIPQGGRVSVRGWISDHAKNTAQDQVDRQVAAANEAVPRPKSPDFRQPVAGRTPDDAQSLTMSDQFPGVSRAVTKHTPDARPTSRGEGDESPGPMRTANDSSQPRGSFVSQRHTEETDEPAINANGGRASATEAGQPVAAGPRRVVNARQFQIGYRLHDVEPGSVDAVELYITTDGGAVWYRYGEDEDRRSPVPVEVPGAGTYGFTLGIRTGVGESTEVPRNGDPPALEVVVDQTPPQIELLPLRQGRGKSANKILVQWKCSDEFPAEQPVALYCAATAQGPWRKIADWTENTGRYVWTVDGDVPAKFLLRIEARDQAGNVQAAETPHPVLLDLGRPTARSLDLEPSPARPR